MVPGLLKRSQFRLRCISFIYTWASRSLRSSPGLLVLTKDVDDTIHFSATYNYEHRELPGGNGSVTITYIVSLSLVWTASYEF